MLSKDALISVIGRVGAIGCGFLIQVLLARTLSQDDMGRYFLLLSVVVTAALLNQLGMQRLIVREFAGGRRSGASTEVVLGSLLGIFCSTYVVSVSAILAGYYALFWDQTESVLFPIQIAFLLFLMGASQLLGAILRGFHRVAESVLLTDALVQGLTFLGIAVWFFVAHGPNSLDRSIVPLNLALALATIVLAVKVGRLTTGGLRYSSKVARWLVGQAGPLLVIDLTFLVYNPFLLWVVSLSSSVATVALFGVCARLGDFLLMPKRILGLSLEPRLARYLAEGRMREAELAMRSTAATTGWAAVAGTLIYILIGEALLAALFGEGYVAAYPFLVIIALSRLTGPTIEGFSALAMQMVGRQKTVMKAEIVLGLTAAALMLTAAFLGSELYIAVAYACAFVTRSCTLWFITYKYLGLKSHMFFTRLW